jgi:hypothetical protein
MKDLYYVVNRKAPLKPRYVHNSPWHCNHFETYVYNSYTGCRKIAYSSGQGIRCLPLPPFLRRYLFLSAALPTLLWNQTICHMIPCGAVFHLRFWRTYYFHLQGGLLGTFFLPVASFIHRIWRCRVMGSFETSMNLYRTTWRHISEDSILRSSDSKLWCSGTTALSRNKITARTQDTNTGYMFSWTKRLEEFCLLGYYACSRCKSSPKRRLTSADDTVLCPRGQNSSQPPLWEPQILQKTWDADYGKIKAWTLRDSAVSIATGYGLYNREVGVPSPGTVKNLYFSTSSRPALGSTQPPNQWVAGALSGR